VIDAMSGGDPVGQWEGVGTYAVAPRSIKAGFLRKRVSHPNHDILLPR
jgi:hypothetical protein